MGGIFENSVNKTENKSGIMHRFFAIASMMNPTSLKLRDIHPVSSRPAQILDYKLGYFGDIGMAEAIPEKGESFHGVVHFLTDEEMTHLDEIEAIYDKKAATVRYYDGTEDTAFVYCKSTENARYLKAGIPHERYIDLMIEGALHYGVDPDYIESLRKLERIPRPDPCDFRSYGPPPPGVTMTLEEVMKCDGEEGRPLYFTVNGKIIHIKDPSPEVRAFMQMARKKFNSPATEDWYPKIVYDPRYGVPESAEKCSSEHAAYMEHQSVTHHGSHEGAVVIGSIDLRPRT